MRQRNPENKGLPARWRHYHGAYYYQVPEGQEHAWEGRKQYRLGVHLHEAYRVWSDRLATLHNAPRTMGEVFDRYLLQVVPTKAPKTQSGNVRQIALLRAVFGEMPPATIRPQVVYGYVDRRSAKVAAHREVAVLSHALTKAVEWGVIDRHPFKNEMRLGGEKPRTRYVEDWEVEECLSLPCRMRKGSVRAVQAYVRLKLLTGLRRGDLLRLTKAHCTQDGIAVTTSKTGRPVMYRWTNELREAVDMALEARPKNCVEFLFCTDEGKPYLNEATGDAYGWNSLWQRFMKRVLEETKVTQRFTEHDLRAKCASDAKTLDHAQALLAHADSRLTKRVYRRKPEVINPLR